MDDFEKPSRYTTEQKQEIIQKFKSQWDRLSKLAGEEDTYFDYMDKAARQMEKVTSGSGAVGAMVNVESSLKGYSSSSVRLGQIKVQPKSIARSAADAPKTSKRLPAGRKPNTASEKNSTKKKVKRRRQIAESIRNNIAHVKAH